MPLFTFKCPKCEYIVEKFLHKLPENIEVICENCKTTCDRQFSKSKTLTVLDARETLKQQILPDAKRMVDNISKGKDKDIVDVYGDN